MPRDKPRKVISETLARFLRDSNFTQTPGLEVNSDCTPCQPARVPVDVYNAKHTLRAKSHIEYRQGVQNDSSTATHACETWTGIHPPGVQQASSCGNVPLLPLIPLIPSGVYCPVYCPTWDPCVRLLVYGVNWFTATAVPDKTAIKKSICI